MTITQTKCPECGGAVTPGDECPECGAWVDREAAYRLESGERYAFEYSSAKEAEALSVVVEAVDLWLGLPDRRVFWARVDDLEDDAECPDALEGWLLLEENHAPQASGLAEASEGLPESVARRVPLAETQLNGRTLRLYGNRGGLSVEEIVELADRRLDLFQVAVIFDQILEDVQDLHQSGFLHLTISPRTLRLGGAAAAGGIPEAFAPPDAEAAETQGFDDISGDTDGGLPGLDLGSVGEPVRPDGLREGGEETANSDVGAFGLEEETQEDYSPPGIPKDEASEDEDGSDGAQEAGGRPDWAWIMDLGISLPGLESCRDLDGDRAFDGTTIFEGASGLWPFDELSTTPPRVKGYAPPEFYGRAADEADATADVFGLGMLLYHLVAGRRPPASVYTRHTAAIPARNFRPDFPPGLGPVIKRATRPDPEMRYPDVGALRRAFTEAVDTIVDRAFGADRAPAHIDASVDRHVGIAKRERNPVNQDNVFEAASQDREFSLMVVADGVSTASYGTGEIASRMTVEVAESVWERVLPKYLMGEAVSPLEIVEEIVDRANQRIVDYVNQRYSPFSGSAHEVMGTTALICVYRDGVVTLGSVGDSRAYLQRGSGLEQLTIDHNLWTLGILEGLPADDSLSMPRGDALARCLGTFNIDGGELEPTSPGADIFQFQVAEGDTLLLTTDGLVDFAGGNVFAAEENILATLLSEPDPALGCLELILLANRGGGGDNIGLGIAKFSN